MSDLMTPDLETRLAGWLAGRAPTEVPEDFAARIVAIPRAAPRAKPVRVKELSRFGRRNRPMLLAAAVAALTVALIAGGLFIASRRNSTLPLASVAPSASPSPTPVPTPEPTIVAEPSGAPALGLLPGVIPDGVENGVIDTPIGSARWVHLQGDATTLPEPLQPIALHDGSLAWFQQGGPGVACSVDPKSTACTDPPGPALTVSDDVLAPRQAKTLPIHSATADLRLIGDTFWLVTSGPFTVWQSSDLKDWTKVDTSGLRSPGPASIEWATDLSPFAVAADSTIASVHYAPADPGALLGHPGEQVRLATADTGGFTATQSRPRSQGGALVLGPITVDEVAGGIRFVDGAGKEVGRVEGVGREFADSWASRGEIRYDRIAAFNGTAWSNAELPVAQPVDWPMVVPLDHGAMVFVTEPDTHVRAWRTTDGQTWTGGDLILGANGTPIESGGVTYRGLGKSQVIVAFSVDGTSSWTSTDGEQWVAGPEDSSVPAPIQFDHGFMRTGDQTVDGGWQVSRDGTTFEDVPALRGVVTKVTPAGAGGSTEFAIGDAVFFVVSEDQGSKTRDMWIIEFEAPSP